MSNLTLIVILIFTDLFIGATFLSLIDDENKSLYTWYSNCPVCVSFFFQPLVLLCWPYFLYIYFRSVDNDV